MHALSGAGREPSNKDGDTTRQSTTACSSQQQRVHALLLNLKAMAAHRPWGI